MNFLKSFIITCTPVILGGIFNMIFTKTKIFKNHAKPIDMGRYFVDGKPIFGKKQNIFRLCEYGDFHCHCTDFMGNVSGKYSV